MHTVIIVIHLMLVVALTGVVLLQKSEGGGLGIGGGGGFMSSRGTANLLTRTTAFLAAGFFATSLLLSWLAGLDRTPSSLINSGSAPVSQPATPVAPSSGGVLDALKQQEQQAPAGPQAPQSR
ncbi:MAG: preprotein translocase subunit SecG [Rhizobiales bacterium 62-47]|mgnify:CR=1 FL=1|nr:preprotein translocase subunit SecG [Hyphomicrobiales bacterium]OJY10247.1 MAG: preprotein translocase subunit SecG [Rhizobiales bacterium 62-47]